MHRAPSEGGNRRSQKIRAIEFAKSHRTRIARAVADLTLYPGEGSPISVFMAGSPGAGKTEVATGLIAEMEQGGARLLHLDPDNFRNHFPEYAGNNSYLFQKAVTRIVERVHDLALSQCQSFLLDGTLANARVAERNLQRSLARDRQVQIVYVYQQPALAWEFVLAREAAEGRNIPCNEFVRQYFAAYRSVVALMARFGDAVQVDVILKDAYGRSAEVHVGVSESFVDEVFDCPYDPDDLHHQLNECIP